MKNLIVIIFSIVIFSSSINAQSSVNTTMFDAIMENNFVKDGPGVSALVAKDGKVIYTKAMGHANIELDVATNTEHIFRIGSITKQFTAVAILMLEEQGKLSIQDELIKFIPDYPTQGKTITIEHLLRHTSGIMSYTNMPTFAEVMKKEMSKSDIVNMFKDVPMEFDPGAEFKYNNSGYYLLGIIIEKASGISYSDFIQKNIFDKASMNNSYYDTHSPVIKNRAAGYDGNNGNYSNAMHISMDWPYAAGALMSTVGDLLKWNTALHDGQLISKTSLAKAFVDFELPNGNSTNYGYGWVLSKLYGSDSYEHNGGIPGFLSQGVYLPKEKIYVAVLSNCMCQSPDFAGVQLAAAAMGKQVVSTSKIELSDKVKRDYMGVYQISGEDKRVITLQKDGQLYSQRGGGRMFLISPMSKDKFSVEKSLTVFEFVRNAEGKVIEMISHTRDGSQEKAKLTDEKPPKAKEEIKVDSKVLDRYVGSYELAPTFSINITNENGQLHLQATGQQKFPAFAESETKFFLKVVPAVVEFFKDDKGVYSKMVLYQNGAEMPGIRK